MPSAVSVGAADDGGAVAGLLDSASYLDLLAPGVSVTSSVPAGGFANMSGTSMAAPHVAGAFALVRQAYPNAGVTELLSRLQQTGVRITDPKSGRTTPRIDIDRASRFASFPSDFTRDLRADFAVWRPSTGEWWVPGQPTPQWGQAGDKPVPGDYDGDGGVEKAIWRPSDGMWSIPGVGAIQWGTHGDVPVPGDYNGDGRTDVAVWRPSTGDWWVRGQFTEQWGAPNDVPVPADYNGDGRTDVAVWRPSTGEWWVRGQFTQQWGTAGDVATPRDITGDGRAELVVWRPGSGTWFWLTKIPIIGNITGSQQWGTAGDVPVGPTAQQLR